jgi:hypothetical protein
LKERRLALTSEAQITYRPRAGTTPEVELTALAAVYRFLLLEKGDRHDLMNDSTKKWTTSPDKPSEEGQEIADVHRN